MRISSFCKDTTNMKAIIKRGKYKGKVVDISQWCNDWFTIDTDIIELAVKPFSPTSLLFTHEGFNQIRDHKNNGFLFSWYEPYPDHRNMKVVDGQIYALSFKKRK